MMRVLNPTYTIRVDVTDAAVQQTSFTGGGMQGSVGNTQPYNPHKFFNGLTGKTGCDEALAAVKDALSKAGITAEVFLERFEHR